MSVSLNHRNESEQTVTAGLYCCVVPTTEEEFYSCIILRKLNLTRALQNAVFLELRHLLITVYPCQCPHGNPCCDTFNKIVFVCHVLFQFSDSQQDVSCPQCMCDNTDSVVGCVVAMVVVLLIIVGVVTVTYLILRHKRQGSV